MKKRLFILCIALLSFNKALSVTYQHLNNGVTAYYVSPSGSDSNDGSSVATPFRTLSKAVTVLGPGTTLFVRGGVYRETVKLLTSGTATAPITIEPYQNEQVVINGTDVVSNWIPYTGNIYHTQMSWDLGTGNNQVFVDGGMMDQARFPHKTLTNSLLNPATTTATVGGQTYASAPLNFYSNATTSPVTVTSKDFNQPDNTWVGAYMVGEVGEAWCDEVAQITSSSSNGTLTVVPKVSAWWFNGPGNVYVFGVLAALGAPGEWHNQYGDLYLWSPYSDDPNKHLVEVKHRLINLDFNNQSYINVQGLSFVAGAVLMTGNNCSLVNCDAKYLSHFILYPRNDNGGVELGVNGYQGIYLSGSNNLIRGCSIAYSAGCGIDVEGVNNIIIRNTIHDIDYAGGYSSPVYLGYTSRNTYIWYNTIYNAGRDLILILSPNHDIKFNDLSYPSLLAKDDGCIYTGEVIASSTRIAYNWVHDIYEPGGAGTSPPHGIYLDSYCAGYTVDHNICWNFMYNGGPSPMGIFLNRPVNNVQVSDNIIFNCGATSVQIGWASLYPNANPNTSYWTSDFNNYTEVNDLYLGTVTDVGSVLLNNCNWSAGVNGMGVNVPVVISSVDVQYSTNNRSGLRMLFKNTNTHLYKQKNNIK